MGKRRIDTSAMTGRDFSHRVHRAEYGSTARTSRRAMSKRRKRGTKFKTAVRTTSVRRATNSAEHTRASLFFEQQPESGSSKNSKCRLILARLRIP
jgi:hypothetical protein|tara:strand:+ start:12022 stop:12309 length:288 start_codon:yes stop_codon:yes gene_type:complete